MLFRIEGKVALVTGGASGIGHSCALDLLRKGLKGVTLADLNDQQGAEIVRQIEKEFGKNRAIFVRTDVTDPVSFRNAFERTLEVFKNVDILINSAGLATHQQWEKVINVNLTGTAQGVFLGFEQYLAENTSSSEGGVIVNVSSVAGIVGLPASPVYSASKWGVIGLTLAFGNLGHYKRNNVRVMAICPGQTDTPFIAATENVVTSDEIVDPAYRKAAQDLLALPIQKVEVVASSVSEIIENAKTGSIWIIDGGKPLYEHKVAQRK